MPSTSELLVQWDATRPRTQQQELGMSEVGGCRRRAGYRLAGTPASNAPGSVQATLGVAVHDAVERISRDLGYSTETEVYFAGIRGHFDRREDDELVDVKTVGTDRWLEHIELHGPPEGDIFQVMLYAAALIRLGILIRTVRIDYIARDTGREWQYRARFDVTVVREALAWVAQVRDTPLDLLPRDYAPEGPFCRHCPFFKTCWEDAVPERDPRSAIWVDDPDTARYAEELFDLRARLKELKEREEQLRGILDAVRPTGGGLVDYGGPRILDFRNNGKGGYNLHFRPQRIIT